MKFTSWGIRSLFPSAATSGTYHYSRPLLRNLPAFFFAKKSPPSSDQDKESRASDEKKTETGSGPDRSKDVVSDDPDKIKDITSDGPGRGKNVASSKDSSDRTKKFPYPWWVAFIVAYGLLRSLSGYITFLSLVFYLKAIFLGEGYGWDKSEDYGSAVYHTLEFVRAFVPVFGAVLADSWLGYFNTIFYLGIPHTLSYILLSIGSRPNNSQGIPGNPRVLLSMVALSAMCLFAGLSGPSLEPLELSQFKMPEQQQHLIAFIGWQQMIAEGAALILNIVLPFVRVSGCMGEEECFPYIFDVCSAMMVLGFLLLIIGKRWLIIKMPERSAAIDFFKTVWRAIRNRCRAAPGAKKDHWLDYAESQCSTQQIDDAKAVCRLLLLLLLDPVSSSASILANSRILLQASHMDCKLAGNFYILPEHLHLVGMFVIVIFIPIFMYLGPIMDKKGFIATPLKKDVVSNLSFAVILLGHALLEFQIEKSYPHEITGSMGRLSVFNGLGKECSITANFEGDHLPMHLPDMVVKAGQSAQVQDVKGLPALPFDLPPDGINITVKGQTSDKCGSISTTVSVHLQRGKSSNIFFFQTSDGSLAGHTSKHTDVLKKSETGVPYLRIIYHLPGIGIHDGSSIAFSDVLEEYSYKVEVKGNWETGDLDAVYDRKLLTEEGNIVCLEGLSSGQKICSHNGWFSRYLYQFKFGASYNMYLQVKGNNASDVNLIVNMETVVLPNRVHVGWVLLLMAFLGIIIAYTTPSIELFYYSQSPQNLKALIGGLHTTLGSISNLIAATLMATLSNVLDSQAHEFLLFVGIIVVFSMPYNYFVWNYRYSEYDIPLPEHWPRTLTAEARRKDKEEQEQPEPDAKDQQSNEDLKSTSN